MKRILLTALTFAAVTSFAQLKPGPGGHHGGHGPNQGGQSIEIQQIQLDIQSTRLSLQNALASLKINPKLSASNIQQAMMRLDSISAQVNALEESSVPNPPIATIVGYYVALKSTSGALFGGEAPTKIQAIEKAQKACFDAEYDGNCQTVQTALTTNPLLSFAKTSYCSLKSISGAQYGSEGRVTAEATVKAQKACMDAEYDGNCVVSTKSVTCE